MNYHKLENEFKHFQEVLIILNINPEILHKLKRLDTRYYTLALNYCNGLIESNLFEIKTEAIEIKVKDLLKDRADRIKFNSDPRGHAIKIKEEYTKDTHIIRDWGGDGILFPEF